MKENIRKPQKAESDAEERVIQILTHEKLSAIKAMLEKEHAIDCLFLLFLNKGRWGDADDLMNQRLDQHLPDGTFRARMLEIWHLKLARRKRIGNHPNQYRYVITDFGLRITKLLVSFFDGLQWSGFS